MDNFVIYTNLHKDKDLKVTTRVQEYLASRGKKGIVWVRDEQEDNSRFLTENAECMIVLGGDGTMLQAARDVKQQNMPLIGVNLGTLGYLAEMELTTLEESLDRLMADDFVTESRMMLKGQVFDPDGASREEDLALNDIVIVRNGSLQIIKFHVYVNGQFLNGYDADGVIITTPTGSTGYNLSAGGPIVEPGARLMMITPICPHTLNQRSIILSPEDVIEIEIPKGKEGREQTVFAGFDGSNMIPMKTGERIKIMIAEKTTNIIKLSSVSFLEILHKKMSQG